MLMTVKLQNEYIIEGGPKIKESSSHDLPKMYTISDTIFSHSVSISLPVTSCIAHYNYGVSICLNDL